MHSEQLQQAQLQPAPVEAASDNLDKTRALKGNWTSQLHQFETALTVSTTLSPTGFKFWSCQYLSSLAVISDCKEADKQQGKDLEDTLSLAPTCLLVCLILSQVCKFHSVGRI